MDSRKSRLWRERGKTFLILLLTLSALYLICQFGRFQGLRLFQDGGSGGSAGVITEEQDSSGREGVLTLWPVRMVLQGGDGRYGVQYSQSGIRELFESTFGNLLREALNTAGQPEPITEEQWRQRLTGEGVWAYYDFVRPLPLGEISVWLKNTERRPDLDWNVRQFLLTEDGGQRQLLCQNEDSGQYYRFSLPEGGGEPLSYLVGSYAPNGAVFAFEQPEVFGTLAPDTLILKEPPTMTAYGVSNPLGGLTEGDMDELLRALSFNPKIVSRTPVADGQRFQEGLDSLGLTQEGTITYHSRQGGTNRYPVEEMTAGALVERSRELLSQVIEERLGDGTYHLRSVSVEEDGKQVEVFFEYWLDGTPVQVFQEGWAARFTFTEGELLDFTIHVRQYTRTETASPVLPEVQAAAAMPRLLQEGRELLLCYTDRGDAGQVLTQWTAY